MFGSWEMHRRCLNLLAVRNSCSYEASLLSHRSRNKTAQTGWKSGRPDARRSKSTRMTGHLNHSKMNHAHVASKPRDQGNQPGISLTELPEARSPHDGKQSVLLSVYFVHHNLQGFRCWRMQVCETNFTQAACRKASYSSAAVRLLRKESRSAW